MCLAIAANKAHFCDCFRNSGYFVCGVDRVLRFVIIRLHERQKK